MGREEGEVGFGLVPMLMYRCEWVVSSSPFPSAEQPRHPFAAQMQARLAVPGWPVLSAPCPLPDQPGSPLLERIDVEETDANALLTDGIPSSNHCSIAAFVGEVAPAGPLSGHRRNGWHSNGEDLGFRI